VTAVILGSILGGLAASAGTSDPTRHSSTDGFHACVSRDGHSRLLNGAIYRGASGTCPNGYALYVWDKSISLTHALLRVNQSVPTGGDFVARSTEVGTIDVPAGTYTLSLNAKVKPPVGGTGAVDVFPQFFVYDRAKNADWLGDLFNVGSGAIESGTNSNIDSYYSGSSTIHLSTPLTLHVYAFGYDSDTGGGSYVLENLTVNLTQVS